MTRNNGEATAAPSRSQQKVARLLERLPPHAIEAEECTLGCVIVEPSCLDDVMQILVGDDFSKPSNGEIFVEMISIYEDTKTLDIQLLRQRLIDLDIIDAVGSEQYLVDLANCMPSASNAVHYARQVYDKAIVRRLIEQAGQIIEDAHSTRCDGPALLAQAEQRIFKIGNREAQQPSRCLGDTLGDALDSIDPTRNKNRALKTGFIKLDELTSGLRKGEVTVIAGRPSMGKSALAMNMATNIAKYGAEVLFFSVEMTRLELGLRILSSESGVSLQTMKYWDNLSPDDHASLGAARWNLDSTPLCLDGLTDLMVTQLRARARLHAKKSNLGAIFVDYLQRLKVAQRTESRHLDVGEMSRAMKTLAMELDVPVVVLSQLNRASEQRQHHVPQLSDLRESGDIEQDADVVLLLHREDYYHKTEKDYTPDNLASLIIAKQRNGPPGLITLTWHGPTTTFKNYSDASMYAGGAV